LTNRLLQIEALGVYSHPQVYFHRLNVDPFATGLTVV